MEGVISLKSNTVLFFKSYPSYWPFFYQHSFIVLILNTLNGYFFLIADDNCAIKDMLSDDLTRLVMLRPVILLTDMITTFMSINWLILKLIYLNFIYCSVHIVTNRIKRIFVLIELNLTELSRAVGFRRRALAVPNSIHKWKK